MGDDGLGSKERRREKRKKRVLCKQIEIDREPAWPVRMRERERKRETMDMMIIRKEKRVRA